MPAKPVRIYSNTAVFNSLDGSGITNVATTFTFAGTPTGWPGGSGGPSLGAGEVGLCALDYGDQTKIEIVTYTGISGNVVSGLTRGVDGTSAQAHAAGARAHHVASAWDIELASQGIPPGTIQMYIATTAPPGRNPRGGQAWVVCDGTAISRTTYADLFGAISTTYGVGDGATTFNVPNLKGRVPVGLDTADTLLSGSSAIFDALNNSAGGSKRHQLVEGETPSHNHGAGTGTHTHTTPFDAIDTTTSTASGRRIDRDGNDVSVSTGAGQGGHTHTSFGGGGYHNNTQPYLVVQYIIKT